MNCASLKDTNPAAWLVTLSNFVSTLRLSFVFVSSFALASFLFNPLLLASFLFNPSFKLHFCSTLRF